MDIMIYRLLLFYVLVVITTRLIFGNPIVNEMNFDVNTGNSINETYEVCQSDDCKKAELRILSAMNKSADPCENFYEFVCGNWTIPPDLPEDEIQRSYISILTRKIDTELKEILEEEIQPDNDELLRKLKLAYRSCMNLDERDRVGVKPILNYLNAIGGWPMTMANDTWQNHTWQEVDNHFLAIDGHSSFFTIKFIPYYENPSLLSPFLQPQVLEPLAISTTVYNNGGDPNNPHIKTINELAWIIAQATGSNVSRENIAKEAIQLYNFQRQVSAALSPRKLMSKDRNYEKWTLGELQNCYNNENDESCSSSESSEFQECFALRTIPINFVAVFESLYNSTGVAFNENQHFQVQNWRSFKKLTNVLNRTSNRIIVNYIHYNFVARMMKYANRQLLNIQKETYNYNYLEFMKNIPQWRKCLTEMEMDEGLSYYYVQRYFVDDHLPLLNETIEIIKNATMGRILRSKWLDDGIKEIIGQKIMSMEKLLGYPDYLKNLTHMTKLYEDVLVGENYVETILSQHKCNMKKKLSRLQSPEGRRTWQHYNAFKVNAYYLRIGNVMIIPAGILQDPYFVPSLPSALLYGSLGFIIGHEFSHSLDTLGRYFDTNGTFADWWSTTTTAIYNEKSKCFVEQYNNYTVNVPNKPSTLITLNGKKLQDENLADSTSIKATFDAFRMKLEQEGRISRRLPGLEEFTDDQIFFITFAHSWCDALLPNYVEVVTRNAKHSPARARIHGALSNVEEFSATFKCPVGSPLNPVKKCSLW